MLAQRFINHFSRRLAPPRELIAGLVDVFVFATFLTAIAQPDARHQGRSAHTELEAMWLPIQH